MDLLDIITEKKFLAQEFLAWLWWMGDNSGAVETKQFGVVGVEVKDRIAMESSSDQGKAVCSGSLLAEAITGLAVGKKPEQAKLKMRQFARNQVCQDAKNIRRGNRGKRRNRRAYPGAHLSS